MSKHRQDCPEPYAGRIQRVREAIAARPVDGYLVTDRRDQYWLTGFTGESGFVLITRRNVVLITDGRFDETADLEAPWATKVVRRKRGVEETARIFRKYRLGALAFDPGHMTVAAYTGFRKALAPTKLVSVSGLIGDMRQIKDAGEIEAIRKAIDVCQRAFRKATAAIRPGHSERKIAARLVYEMQLLGAEEAAFGPIVAVGANGSLPHYEPAEARADGKTPILIDWGARLNWYVSDLTRVIHTDSIPPRIRKVYETVRKAHDAAVEAARPGVSGEHVDRAARRVIDRAGYGPNFSHGLGHGIGLDVHENPRLGRGSKGLLSPGMVVTIEPGIYLPGVGGVRIESDVLVTPAGCEVLSDLPY